MLSVPTFRQTHLMFFNDAGLHTEQHRRHHLVQATPRRHDQAAEHGENTGLGLDVTHRTCVGGVIGVWGVFLLMCIMDRVLYIF